MSAITLEITPDLESRLQHEAAREGLDTQGYILSTLRERLAGVRRSTVPRLPADEAALLKEIGSGKGPTLLATSHDLLARAVVEDLRQMEVAVPEQVSVLGFEGDGHGSPGFGLATLAFDLDGMAVHAVESASRLVRGESEALECSRQFPVTLIDGPTLAARA